MSSACLEFVESIGALDSDANWQRCVVHFFPKCLHRGPSGHSKESGHDAQNDLCLGR